MRIGFDPNQARCKPVALSVRCVPVISLNTMVCAEEIPIRCQDTCAIAGLVFDSVLLRLPDEGAESLDRDVLSI